MSNLFSNRQIKVNSGLEIITLLAWGCLLLRYSLTGQLKLLIHPNYFGLVLVCGIVLIILGLVKTYLLLKVNHQAFNSEDHLSLLSPRLGIGLLLSIAIAGFIIQPKVLTSQTALQRGVTETLPNTRLQPQSFHSTIKPEERSLIDWIRTLNAYPEPDSYSNQPAKISGFVVYSEELAANYILLSRFIITCCAVDAYPIGLPVKLEVDRHNYPQDSWLEVEGKMITETFTVQDNRVSNMPREKRQLVVKAKSIKKIPTPSDPYNYN